MTQRTGTKLLTLDEQRILRQLLDFRRLPDELPADAPARPSETGAAPAGPQPVASGPRRPAWKGANDADFRETLRVQMTAVLDAALTETYVPALEKSRAPRLPMDRFHSVASAAKNVVDRRFRLWLQNAALPRPTAARRSGFVFTSDQPTPTLLDCTDTAVRAATPQPVSAENVARHLATTDPKVLQLVAAAGLDPRHGSTEERNFYQQTFLEPFIAKNREKLDICERFGYLITDPVLCRVFLQPNVVGWKEGEPETVDAVQQKKWKDFFMIVHEYIHVLEHPVVPVATDKSDVVREGFCEYLALMVIRGLANASADILSEIALLVTGSADNFPNRQAFAQRQPTEKYQAFVAATEAAVQIIGENGLMAAFLQGHSEFLGKDPRWGSWLAPARVGRMNRSVPLPHAYNGRWNAALLASLTGTTETKLVEANPIAATAWGLYEPGEANQLELPGFRGHRVLATCVEADETVETWEQIAAQQGIPLDQLRDLNPDGPTVREFSAPEEVKNDWVVVPDA